MSWNTLRGQISTLVDTISTIQEVSGTPKLKFEGYPAAYIIPSDSESDYETTIENERVYAFLIRIFYETKNTGVGEALNALEDVVDSIIDLVDQEDKKPGSTRTIGINLPADYIFLSVEASPSLWGELPEDELLMAEIRVKVHISFDAS